MENTDCDVCFHHYDDQLHLPRTLSCDHSLCSQCITEAIRAGQLTCPYCRQDHHTSNARDIPINFALMDRSLSKLKVQKEEEAGKITKTTEPQSVQDQSGKEVDQEGLVSGQQAVQNPVMGITASMAVMASAEPTVHAGVCLTHRAYKSYWCKSCMVWTCLVCYHQDHMLKTCQIITIHEALHSLKQEEKVLFANHKEAYLNHSQFMQEYCGKLESRIEKHEAQVGLFQALREGHAEAINRLKRAKENVAASLEEAETTLQKMDDARDHLMKVNAVESIKSAQKELHVRSKVLQEMITESKDDICKDGAMQLSDKLGEDMKMMFIASGYSFGNPLEDAGYLRAAADRMFKERISVDNIQYLASKTQIWAISRERGWAAPISLQDGRIHLHCLRKVSEMPEKTYTLPFGYVRHLVNKTPEVFIQLSWQGKIHGQFYITLDSKAENHSGMLHRCVGTNITSFRNTPVSSHRAKQGQQVPSQFYGGITYSTITFTKARGPMMACRLGNGLVTLGVEGDKPCFIVWYKPYLLQFPEQRSDIQVGWVTKGLHIVETVAESPGIAEYTISDCGVVIV